MRICLLFLLVIVASCATRDPNYVVLRDPKSNKHKISKIEDGSLDPKLKGVWQYGLLSSAAYFPERTNLNNMCVHKSSYGSRWVRNMKYSKEKFPPVRQRNYGVEISGFDYGVWQDISAKNPKRVAISFRGTDFKEPGDWYSNLRFVTRFNPGTWDQYQQTRDLIPVLVRKLKLEYGDDVQIITTGHSLGGGLAQHAAYSSKDIKLVYAFATSPITGATSLDSRVSTDDVEIYRPYEAGEALSILRWGSRRLISLPQENPKVTEVRFNLRSTYNRGREGDGPISQHSIRRFSCDLICRVEKGFSPKLCGTGN